MRMANKKNKNNKNNNTHKHVYRKKKLPLRGKKVLKEKLQESGSQENGSQDNSKHLTGSRIMDLEQLQKFIEIMNKHSAVCEGSVTLNHEDKAGLASILSEHCEKCNQNVRLETSN